MLQTKQLTLGELDTHCYLVWCSNTLEAVVIDPAAAGDFISQEILDLQLKPLAVLLTHGHFDHCLGSLEVKLNFGIPLLIHADDLFLLARARESARHWLRHSVDPIPPADGVLDPTSLILLGDEQLAVLETPGHTPGSVCYFSAGKTEGNTEHFIFSEEPILFSGDTLFKGELGSTNHRYSKPLQLSESLQKIGQLPPNTTVLPGHGELTTMASESHLWKRQYA
jgi:hydroxyacylglutathione hydrolase